MLKTGLALAFSASSIVVLRDLNGNQPNAPAGVYYHNRQLASVQFFAALGMQLSMVAAITLNAIHARIENTRQSCNGKHFTTKTSLKCLPGGQWHNSEKNAVSILFFKGDALKTSFHIF